MFARSSSRDEVAFNFQEQIIPGYENKKAGSHRLFAFIMLIL
jgi:hypothetical protein